jgi:hypothetical protein
LEAIEKRVELPIERVDKLRIKEVKARGEIRKFANLGGFVITTNASKILDGLTQVLALSPTDDLYKYYDTRAASVAKALAAVKHEAKNDLRT